MRKAGVVLYDIFAMYFRDEIRTTKDAESMRRTNEKQIFSFYRDYDICPALINKGIAYKIYLQALESPVASVYTPIAMEILG